MRAILLSLGALFSALLLASCSDNNGSDDGGVNPGLPGNTITIQDSAFHPITMAVQAGSTITVINLDNMPHSVTSQPKQDLYIPGAVNGVSFDTGPFTGTTTFTIPASAPPGTAIPYFCTVHKNQMKNDAQIAVVGASPM